jgi:hypothetical protein
MLNAFTNTSNPTRRAGMKTTKIRRAHRKGGDKPRPAWS